jgi:NAD(P)-dependent dehydrogenase (short-subunit alcohol dehydrogenase family)
MTGSRLDGRVIIVTGAGRGIGRDYALLAAAEGARVVVNDLGSGLGGEGANVQPADQVVAEIRALGGEAVADANDVADFEGAAKLINTAIEHFGGLDVVINNAGVLRDRMLVNMSPDEWDIIMRVHFRGHFCVSRHAAAYWRDQSKIAGPADRVLISTSSISGLHGAVGQTNYASAKSGLATFAQLCHRELNERYGVRSYAIAPSGRTRLTMSTPGTSVAESVPEGTFDKWDPANVAPFVIWLAAKGCPIPSGNVFGVMGDRIDIYRTWHIAGAIRSGDRRWTFEDLDAASEALIKQIPPPPLTIREQHALGAGDLV